MENTQSRKNKKKRGHFPEGMVSLYHEVKAILVWFSNFLLQSQLLSFAFGELVPVLCLRVGWASTPKLFGLSSTKAQRKFKENPSLNKEFVARNQNSAIPRVFPVVISYHLMDKLCHCQKLSSWYHIGCKSWISEPIPCIPSVEIECK